MIMQSHEPIFSGGGATKGTVCMAGLSFALAAGTLLVAFFLLMAVFKDIEQIRTRRELSGLESYISKGELLGVSTLFTSCFFRFG